jgi:hypothetical protein
MRIYEDPHISIVLGSRQISHTFIRFQAGIARVITKSLFKLEIIAQNKDYSTHDTTAASSMNHNLCEKLA